MRQKSEKILLATVVCLMFALAVSACGPQAPIQIQVQDLEETARAAIRQTSSALPSQPPLPTLRPTSTQLPLRTAVPTNTIGPTSTQTSTSTPQPTATSPAHALLAGDTNCRTGPSNHYDWVSYIKAGDRVDIVGKAQNKDYWLVDNPYGEGTCWIWGGYATIEGDTNGIPNKPIPPTKTPTRTPTSTAAPRASLYLEQVITCNGNKTLVIRVYNIGTLDLQSYKIKIYEVPGKIQISSEASNQFSHNNLECNRTINNLSRYKIGYAMAAFEPGSATNFTADVQVCTGTGSKGGCVNDYFSFDIYFLTATPTYTPTPTRTSTPTKTSTSTPTKTEVP